MDKFIFSALLYESYREILFITYNYQKEKLDYSDLKKLKDNDYEALDKSKVLYSFYERYINMRNELGEYLNADFLEHLRIRRYDYNTLKDMIDYMNPYVDYYTSYMHSLIDKIAEVLDIKRNEANYKGPYPLYIKIEENRALLERAVINTNAQSYLDGKTKKFGFKMTFIEYDVPLDNYSFNGHDLRELSKKEIIDIMDNSVNVSLEHSNYYDTELLEYKTLDEKPDYSLGELSLFVDKRAKQSSIKQALKQSFKTALISFGIFLVVIIVFVLFKYVFRR